MPKVICSVCRFIAGERDADKLRAENIKLKKLLEHSEKMVGIQSDMIYRAYKGLPMFEQPGCFESFMIPSVAELTQPPQPQTEQ